jgi:hypothetical protein
MNMHASKSNIQDYLITPEPGSELAIFVDHQAAGRSGHLGHALFQRSDAELFAFYPNCTSDDPGRHGTSGHSAVGWMEYRRSSDGGQSWGVPQVLEYSKRAFREKAGYSVFTEKAVVTDNGTVVLFHLLSDVSKDALWEPYLAPTSTRSLDGGETWSNPTTIGTKRGRVYDAIYYQGKILALKFDNDAEEDFCGTTDEHIYRLYESTDDGQSFEPGSNLPFDTRGRGYGTLCQLSDGSIIAYVYNKNDEEYMDYVTSEDGGRTWKSGGRTRLEKRIRNPQMIAFDKGYFLHGRSGSYGPEESKGHFVLYYSSDGIDWDSGIYLARREQGQGAYSNSLVVCDPAESGRERLRIHASHAYSADSTNIVAWWIESK